MSEVLLLKVSEAAELMGVSERTVRRELARLGYVCRRSTWTVRHKAEAEPDYLPKGRGSKRW